MVDFENKMSPSRFQTNPVAGVATSLADLAGDVVELTELNVRLVKADAREAGQLAVTPLMILLVSVALLIACLPVLAFGLASGLAELVEWKLWVAQIVVGVVMALIAVGLCLSALSNIKRAAGRFNRSASELANNVAWLKSVIRGQ